MKDKRPRVTKLTRLDANKKYPHWFYYSPAGHLIGPFDTQEERELNIAKYYKEMESNLFDKAWK